MDSWITYGSFVLFVVAMTGTPGPGNLTLMAVGSSRGFKAGIPVIAGLVTGSGAMNIAVGAGLGFLLTQNPTLEAVLKVLCIGYMLYLSWKIFRLSIAPKEDRGLGYRDGLLIHPLSPKTWAMNVVGFSQFFQVTGHWADETLIFAGTFMLLTIVSHSVWCGIGMGILKILGQGRKLRIFNGFMAAAMLAATGWALYL